MAGAARRAAAVQSARDRRFGGLPARAAHGGAGRRGAHAAGRPRAGHPGEGCHMRGLYVCAI
eukprot:7388458-Prymnesium_polylepis.2